MTRGYPPQCPTVRRGDQAIGFCPSPNGCYVRAWWAHNGNPLGAYPTVELAVAAALAALGSDDPTRDDGDDPAEIAREATRIETALREVDWFALGLVAPPVPRQKPEARYAHAPKGRRRSCGSSPQRPHTTPRPRSAQGHSTARTRPFQWLCQERTTLRMEENTSRKPDQSVDLTKAVIESLKAQGFNQSEIAELYNVSRQAASWHMRTYGGEKSPRQIVNEAWPWKTTAGHGKATAYRRLRDHGEFMQTGGGGMSEDKLDRLKKWWKKLRKENLVVEFDPSIPPIPGIASRGGFAYRARTVDDDMLIRVTEFTELTEEGEMIWRWPPDIDSLI